MLLLLAVTGKNAAQSQGSLFFLFLSHPRPANAAKSVVVGEGAQTRTTTTTAATKTKTKTTRKRHKNERKGKERGIEGDPARVFFVSDLGGRVGPRKKKGSGGGSGWKKEGE